MDETREYEVELSTIAYITVRVKATNARSAGHLAAFRVKGQDDYGSYSRPGMHDAFACDECRALGVTLSRDSLQVDTIKNPQEDQQLKLA
jgi:hypothetical protein